MNERGPCRAGLDPSWARPVESQGIRPFTANRLGRIPTRLCGAFPRDDLRPANNYGVTRWNRLMASFNDRPPGHDAAAGDGHDIVTAPSTDGENEIDNQSYQKIS